MSANENFVKMNLKVRNLILQNCQKLKSFFKTLLSPSISFLLILIFVMLFGKAHLLFRIAKFMILTSRMYNKSHKLVYKNAIFINQKTYKRMDAPSHIKKIIINAELKK